MFISSIGLLTFLMAAALTATARKFALARGIIDHPNARSSHQQPTPRGGGLAIVLALSAASILLCLHGLMNARILAVILVGGGAIALVGFLDDRSCFFSSIWPSFCL
jgi:Fuc2NAc and GlcNAc transferase